MIYYATKTDLKQATGIDTFSFALKSNLASLKTEVDKLDVDKLVPIAVDLSKLSDVVKNDVVKKTVLKTGFNKLVTKVNSINTSEFVSKTKYNTDKSDLEKEISDAEKKIPNTSGLVKKTDYNSKISEIEGKIPSISNSALTAVENKASDVSNLFKKTDYNTKIS